MTARLLRPTRTVTLLSLAIALLALAWTTSPAMHPAPLYDGLGNPDEPYRYVTAPPGYRHTPAATPATGQAVLKPREGAIGLASDETGPQVQVILLLTSFTTPPGATTLSAHADPIPTTSQPSNGQVWGNVYRLTATANNGPAQLHPTRDDQIWLRAPTGPPPLPVIDYNDGAGWKPQPTERVGNDVYVAPVPGFGDFAIVRPSQPVTSTGPAGSPTTADARTAQAATKATGQATIIIVILAIGLAVLAAALIAVRITRSR
jgi:hypothetical protein